MWKKILARAFDILLIVLIIFFSYRILQKKGIVQSKIEKLDRLPNFKVEDIYGEEFNSKEEFKEHDFTIVNIWSPFCGACLEDIQALNNLNTYVEENNGIILGVGIKTGVNRLKSTVEAYNLSYRNVKSNMKMNRDFVSGAVLTPTTIIVNKRGEILELSVGSYDSKTQEEEMKKLIDKVIGQVK